MNNLLFIIILFLEIILFLKFVLLTKSIHTITNKSMIDIKVNMLKFQIIFIFLLIIINMLGKQYNTIIYLDFFVMIFLVLMSIEDCVDLSINSIYLVFLFFICAIKFVLNYNLIYFYNTLISFSIMSSIMILIYFFTRKNFGEGDIYTFILLSVYLGLLQSLSVMMTTFILGGIYASVLIFKGIDVKSKLPLIPFISFAYILNLLNWRII